MRIQQVDVEMENTLQHIQVTMEVQIIVVRISQHDIMGRVHVQLLLMHVNEERNIVQHEQVHVVR